MKDLLTSLRASNETYNSMKHSARAIIRRAEIPLLAVIVLYKAATNLLFVPLMQQLWSLTLRFAPMHYLSNNNASDIFSSPAIILCITLIAILTAFWALYEFSVLLHGLDLARKGETIRLPALLRTSLADIRHAFLPQNWLVLVYSAVLIPFTNFFLAYNYITQLAVPEYIMGVIQANSRYYLLYLAVGAALLFLCVSWVLVLPLFVLERKSLWQSVKESFCCIRRRVFRAFLLLLRWNLSVVLRSLLLTAAVAVPLYGIIIAVGLQSTQAMFALSRAALAIEMPFFQFLIDCAITMAQCTILAMLHAACGSLSPLSRSRSRAESITVPPAGCFWVHRLRVLLCSPLRWHSVTLPCPETTSCSPCWAALRRWSPRTAATPLPHRKTPCPLSSWPSIRAASGPSWMCR